jgi:hypothetical protein
MGIARTPSSTTIPIGTGRRRPLWVSTKFVMFKFQFNWLAKPIPSSETSLMHESFSLRSMPHSECYVFYMPTSYQTGKIWTVMSVRWMERKCSACIDIARGMVRSIIDQPESTWPMPNIVLSQTKIYESLLVELESDDTIETLKSSTPSFLNEGLCIMAEQYEFFSFILKLFFTIPLIGASSPAEYKLTIRSHHFRLPSI